MKKLRLLLFFSLLLTVSQAQIINLFAGTGAQGSAGDGGPAASAQLYSPSCVAFDNAGNCYISSSVDKRVRKVNTSGIITTFAGTGVSGTAGDGGLATSAQLTSPFGMTFDAAGNMYLCDGHRIRKIDNAGVITTIAGSTTSGYSGDGGPATSAKLNLAMDVAFDASGNLFIAEYSNHTIRKIDNTGIISTFAGTGTSGFTGDGGQASLAKFSFPNSIAFDASGNLYITDASNNRIRVINSSGVVNTVAGTGAIGYSGDGGQATLAKISQPFGIKADAAGNFYFSDQNNVVRKVNTSGIISTFAGSGSSPNNGIPAIMANLNNPRGLAFSASNELYFAEGGRNMVRKISYCASPITVNISGPDTICPGDVATLIASGATTYSWSTGATTDSIQVSPSTNYGYNVYGFSGGCSAVGSYTGAVRTITFTGNTGICSGDSTVLTAHGANTYTWSANAGSVQTASVSLRPSTMTNYTCSGTVAACTFTAQTWVIVTTTPTISPVASTTVCSNTSIPGTTFTVAGGGTVTWTNSNTGIGLAASGSGNIAAFTAANVTSPTSGVIVATPHNGSCNGTSTSFTIAIMPTPTLTISGATTVFCAAQSTTVTVSGATSYTWSANAGGALTASVSLTPYASSANYTVQGSSPGYCTNSRNVYIAVDSSIFLGGAVNICKGDTVTLSAHSNATSYTWMPGAVASNSVSIHPTASTMYTLTAASPGCNKSQTHFVQVDICQPLGVCNNLGFENGDLSSWTLQSGNLNGATLPCYTCPTGTTCVANVVNSSSAIYSPGYGYTCGHGIDSLTGLPVVAPGGGTYSLLLGNNVPSSGAEQVTQSYAVTSTNNIFIYKFLAVINDYGNHVNSDAPRFVARFLDGSNNPIACYSTDYCYLGMPGIWQTTNYVAYTGWVTKVVDLSAYIGQTVKVQFIAFDCNQGGHFSYAYIDGNCGMMGVYAPVNSVCTGANTITLTAPAGFNSYSWSGPSIVGPNNVQTITVNSPGTYSVTVSGSCGVYTLTQVIGNSATAPSVSVTGANAICTGLPGTLTASGASTYTWSASAGSATSNTVSVSPLGVTSYSVVGVDTSGCTATASVVIDHCVWPGDANEDLVVDNTDLLPMGLHFNSNGSSRLTQGNVWQGDPCSRWNDTLSNGKDIMFSDCDGDGTINYNDTLAISLNYNLTHPAREAGPEIIQATNPEIYLIFDKPQYIPGDTVRAFVNIGKSTSPQSNFYGAAFNINYDNTVVQPGTEKFWFNDSWVGNINQSKIKFSKINTVVGVVDASLVRITHTDTSGFGQIATLQFVLKTGLPSSELYFTISNGIKTNNNGTITSLITGTDSVQVVNGTTFVTSQTSGINVFPNPATDEVKIFTQDITGQLSVFNAMGELVLSQRVQGNITTIKISNLPAGIYTIQNKALRGKFVKE